MVAENFPGSKEAAVAMNNIVLNHIQLTLQIKLNHRVGKKSGVVKPILESIVSELPKYVTQPLVEEMVTAEGTIIPDKQPQMNNDAIKNAASDNRNAIRIKFQEGLQVRGELYDLIPTSRLPLPSPPIPFRVYESYVPNLKKPQENIKNAIVVELELAGFNIDRTEFETKNSLLLVDLYKEYEYLGGHGLTEVVSERKFGKSTISIYLGEGFLPSPVFEIQPCPSDNGVHRIVLHNKNLRNPSLVSCDNLEKHKIRVSPAPQEGVLNTAISFVARMYRNIAVVMGGR